MKHLCRRTMIYRNTDHKTVTIYIRNASLRVGDVRNSMRKRFPVNGLDKLLHNPPLVVRHWRLHSDQNFPPRTSQNSKEIRSALHLSTTL